MEAFLMGVTDVLGALPDPFGLNPFAPKRITKSLSSSWLTAMDWDPDTLELTLTMRGEPFTHYNVPESVAKDLADAPSPGKFWHAAIKDSY
jgi:hypothetical protein